MDFRLGALYNLMVPVKAHGLMVGNTGLEAGGCWTRLSSECMSLRLNLMRGLLYSQTSRSGFLVEQKPIAGRACVHRWVAALRSTHPTD